MFEKNSVGGVGVVSTAFYPMDFYGNNQFIDNRGPSLSVSFNNIIVMICTTACDALRVLFYMYTYLD